MRNYLSFGPISIKLHNRGHAPWGYPSIRIGGLSLFDRASNGNLILASYHPRSSATWLWAVSIGERNGDCTICRSRLRVGQWHDFYNFGSRSLCIARQDYHRKAARPPLRT